MPVATPGSPNSAIYEELLKTNAMKRNLLIEEINNLPILSVVKILDIPVRNRRAMCFNGHDRKTPSLTFSPDKNLWYCHGCGIGGANIQLVMGALNISYSDAITWFARHFSLSELMKKPYRKTICGGYKEIQRTNVQKAGKLEDITNLELNSDIYEWFIKECPLQPNGRQYLNKRCFSDKTINCFYIGQLDLSITKKCLKTWSKERLTNCGLFKKRGNIKSQDIQLIWWDQTIIFPFMQNKRIVYLQGRRLIEDYKPKYIGLNNIPKPLFNIDILNKQKKGAKIYLCEGIPDVLAAFEMGLSAVGVLGAHSFKEEYVELLQDFNVTVIPDNDKAGKKFADKIQQCFNTRGLSINIAHVSKGKDLADYLLISKKEAK